MIELPRAAVTADEIATQADFFSFGTNDLTQTTFGFSRDDVEGEFIPQYLEEQAAARTTRSQRSTPVLPSLSTWASTLVIRATPISPCGVCGEHGGDPDSIHTFNKHRSGLRVLLALPRAGWPVLLLLRLRFRTNHSEIALLEQRQ